MYERLGLLRVIDWLLLLISWHLHWGWVSKVSIKVLPSPDESVLG